MIAAKGRHRFYWALVLCAALLPLVLWLICSLVVPLTLAPYLSSRLAERYGLSSQLRMDPLLLSPHGASIGFSLGTGEREVISVPSLRASFRLSSLITQRRIEKITLSGTVIRCAYENGRIMLDDPQLRQLLLDTLHSASPPAEKTAGTSPLFTVNELIIDQATLICRIGQRRILLPLSLACDLDRLAAEQQLEFHLICRPFEQQLALQGTFDLNTKTMQLHARASNVAVEALESFLQYSSPVAGIERLDLTTDCTVGLSPFSFNKADGDITLSFSSQPRASNSLQVSSDAQVRLRFKAQPGDKPGSLTMALDGGPTPLTVAAPRNAWRINVTRLAGELLIRDQPPRLTAHMESALSASGNGFALGLPDCSLDMVAESMEFQQHPAKGNLRFSDASLALGESGLFLQQGALRLPFTFPLLESADEGSLQAQLLDSGKRELCSLNARLAVNKKQLAIEGRLTSPLAPPLVATISANLPVRGDKRPLELQAILPRTTLDQFSIQPLFPALGAITVSGSVEATAALSQHDGELQGEGSVVVEDVSLYRKEPDMRVSALSGVLFFPDLPVVRSAPAQKFSFGPASLGNFQLDGGSITFDLETSSSLFIEKATINWAGGSVSSYALRFAEKHLPPELVFYCNQLRLAALLAQFGIKNIEGNGTVNGRLPVRLDGRKIIFEPSYLYSTPGEGGTIRIGGSNLLTQTVSRDSPQFGQLDFAQEALRNFSYNWAKLHLENEGETLVMHLQLDGKPASPLPFLYDSASGSFRRLAPDASPSAGISHPLVLDVNFRFPFNTMIEYDRSIRKLLHVPDTAPVP